MIDTDTRQLKRTAQGFKTGAGKIICDHCAVNLQCDMNPREVCDVFVPALAFQDETGLLKVSNTMRIGQAWAKRLELGQHVGLFNVKSNELFGYSAVISVDWGPARDMLDRHAHANHLMLEGCSAGAAIELGSWMRQNYGPRIFNKDATLTAIYLLRVDK